MSAYDTYNLWTILEFLHNYIVLSTVFIIVYIGRCKEQESLRAKIDNGKVTLLPT